MLRLNFCVRYGNRWIPQAIITGNLIQMWYRSLRFHSAALPHLQNRTGLTFESGHNLLRYFHFRVVTMVGALDQALDLLVSASYIRYRTSTADLSTSSSLRGLTNLCCGSLILQGGFTLRCLQRLSRPHFASLLCPWQNNSFTRGASIPVLSY